MVLTKGGNMWYTKQSWQRLTQSTDSWGGWSHLHLRLWPKSDSGCHQLIRLECYCTMPLLVVELVIAMRAVIVESKRRSWVWILAPSFPHFLHPIMSVLLPLLVLVHLRELNHHCAQVSCCCKGLVRFAPPLQRAKVTAHLPSSSFRMLCWAWSKKWYAKLPAHSTQNSTCIVDTLFQMKLPTSAYPAAVQSGWIQKQVFSFTCFMGIHSLSWESHTSHTTCPSSAPGLRLSVA